VLSHDLTTEPEGRGSTSGALAVNKIHPVNVSRARLMQPTLMAHARSAVLKARRMPRGSSSRNRQRVVARVYHLLAKEATYAPHVQHLDNFRVARAWGGRSELDALVFLEPHGHGSGSLLISRTSQRWHFTHAVLDAPSRQRGRRDLGLPDLCSRDIIVTRALILVPLFTLGFSQTALYIWLVIVAVQVTLITMLRNVLCNLLQIFIPPQVVQSLPGARRARCEDFKHY